MFYQTCLNKVKRWCKTTNLFFRSSVVLIFSFIAIPIYSLLCVASIVLPLSKRHAIVRSYLHMHIYLLKIICHVNYCIEGLENIPRDRPVIVFSKHQSTWETFFLPLIFHAPAIILKRELLWVPFFGWGLAVTQPIAIDRRKQKNAMQEIIKKGQECLSRGRSILIFPEGTRISPGKIGHYKMGGAKLAVATQSPILPIAHNAGYFWRKRGFIKLPGTVRLVVGPLIEVKDHTPEEVLRLAKTWIEDTMVKINGDKVKNMD